MEYETLLICSYNCFKCLAHEPKGEESIIPLSVINKDFKSLCPIKYLYNPAFVKKHPHKKILYICCESINEGLIITVSYDENYNFELLGKVKTGKSACYIELDEKLENLFVINYWDSLITIHKLNNGLPDEYHTSLAEPVIKINCRYNHLKDRQSEAHNHSLLFYKKAGITYALIPDLGNDIIKIYLYENNENCILKLLKKVNLSKKDGPRYMCCIQDYLYVVNELSSTVKVFKIEVEETINLVLIQCIYTIPLSFKKYNTCGNIMIDPSKKYLLVSNRGHDSIAIYKINLDKTLSVVKICPCNGKTPRHFTFNKNGDTIFVANQDSNNISEFKFNNGDIKLNNSIDVKSPNFILTLSD